MEGLEIVFIGTGGSFLSKKRSCSGILCGNILMDFGYGVLYNLRRASVSLDDIDCIYLTHVHSDHIGDVAGIMWAMGLERRKKPLQIVSSEKTEETVKQILSLHATPKKLGVTYCITEHTITNYAYSIVISGKKVTYSGDTFPCQQLIKLAEKSDLLIHDSTYIEKERNLSKVTGHSTVGQAIEVAESACVKSLILTHISPFNEDDDYIKETKKAEGTEVLLARDLLRISL